MCQARFVIYLALRSVSIPRVYISNFIVPICAMAIIEGYIGMALVGGMAAVGTLFVASLVRRAVRK
jgi:hypothetical protein